MTTASNASVRPSAIAGTWYPAGETALRRAVEGYLDQVAPAVLPGRVLALVSPHAGYAYSGPVAAHAYAQVRGAPFERVVLLGPLHRPLGRGSMGPFMVAEETAYRTPLGEVPLDGAFIAALAQQAPLIRVRHDEEHSLEIELPFLQVALGRFSLVPIMFGEHISQPGAAARSAALAEALAALCDETTLLVASTDLTHQDDYAEVIRTDRRLVALVSAFEVDRLSGELRSGAVQACGAGGLVTALKVAQARGARGAQVLAYAASGDVTGDKRPGVYTVGYLAAAAYA